MTEEEAVGALYTGVYHHLGARVNELISARRKLAHYTTGANALNIIRGKSVWLRNAALMNDFSEIGYGKAFLAQALPPKAQNLLAVLEPHHPGLTAEILSELAAVDHAVQNQTYLTSLAEHGPNDEVGKLSMWRAYGGPIAGVALVFNIEPENNDEEAEDLNAYLLPVQYGFEQWAAVFNGLFDYLPSCGDVLADVPRGRAKRILFNVFHDLILTAKHPAFREEEEWRLVHSPYEFSSEWVPPQVEVINDIPQVVHKLDLLDHEGATKPKMSLNRLLYRVIIGPCHYPEQVAHALIVALEKADVQNARDRVRYSAIPLRQRG